MSEALKKIAEIGIVPVIVIEDADKAVPLAKALVAGGIPVIEVTFRTAAGEESIRRIAAEAPDILVGAGTVTTIEQVDRAVAAGAKFVVSPGLNAKVVERCAEKNIPITPGCSNPTDIEAALELGVNTVKFFPAEQAGGLDYIKAVAAPYTGVKFIPTGGINAANITKYLAFERILACGGSWMAPGRLINAGGFDEITSLCKEAVRTVLGFEFAHLGVNGASEAEALDFAGLFAQAFGFGTKNGNSSVFASDAIEITKAPLFGKNGHIAVRVNSINRASAYLIAKGFGLNEASRKTDDKGRTKAIYLEREFGGFAVHLLQK